MKWLLAAAVLAVAASAIAAEKVIREQDRVVVKKKTQVDFTGIDVEGDLTKPEGSYVLDKRKTGFPTRIKVRSSFAPELEKSVDNL